MEQILSYTVDDNCLFTRLGKFTSGRGIPVDLQRLREISDGNPKATADLVADFMVQAGGLLEKTSAAITVGQPEEVGRLSPSAV